MAPDRGDGPDVKGELGVTVGFVLLAHTALARSGQVARHLATAGAPVVIHIDKRTSQDEFHALVDQVSDLTNVHFAPRIACDWGAWSLVDATRVAARQLLMLFPDIGHVALISGSCLPIKPVEDLCAHLQAHPDTDFIESVTIEEVPWAKDGLGVERFTLSFPFAWKRQKRLFDLWVGLQRRLEIRRPIPSELRPHMGSQWWCLTRQTLNAILDDPDRERVDAYFKNVWIPDESYFATLARRHSKKIESRSLTLSKFDFRGNPHVFYDDHLNLLRQSSAFFARKVWPGARRLYGAFLGTDLRQSAPQSAPPASQIDRLFSDAIVRRTRGRPGLLMAGRFPRKGFENELTASPYAVFHGVGDVYQNFPAWSESVLGLRTHGHLFGPDRAEFAEAGDGYVGGLSDNATLRDYNPHAFLTNLIWNTRGEHQAFLYSPRDNVEICDVLARDPNAYVFAISGAWAIPLLAKGHLAQDIRKEAATLQEREAALLARLKERQSRSRLRVWTLAEVLENPYGPLKTMLDDLSMTGARTLSSFPELAPLEGLEEFLQALRNIGMNPYTAGDFFERRATTAPVLPDKLKSH